MTSVTLTQQVASATADGSQVAVSPVVHAVELELGLRGPPGFGAGHEHLQSSASAEWVVNHNLGRPPIVEVQTLGGVTVEAQVVHVSDNQFRVYFNQPQTGKAISR
jgi:hypothetical protein